MKKLLTIAAILGCFAAANAQTKFGAQLNFSTSDLSGLGAGAHAEIFINEKFSIQPSFDYYFAKDLVSLGTVSVKSTTWMINADAHYYFNDEPKIYGIGGLAYVNNTQSGVGVSVPGFGTIGGGDITQSGVGVNLGAGAVFGMFFAEAKYSSKLSGLVLTGGIKFGGE